MTADRTPLHSLHVELGAKLVPFAGFEMPVAFDGTLAEHRHTRAAASLFDVSHMGIARFEGPDVAAALECVVPAALGRLAGGRSRYTLVTNDRGGIVDDLIVSHGPSGWSAVLNAARVDADLAHLRAHLPDDCRVTLDRDVGLLALQGPAAEAVLARSCPEAADLRFMDHRDLEVEGVSVTLSRSGYTGEDGFELLASTGALERLARALLAHAEVESAGLGARDSLRLEAGLCLYGNDLDEDTTPVEAGLTWTIPASRRESGGFPGAEAVARELREGPKRVRVGLRGRPGPIPRAGAELHDPAGVPVGAVTSGAFGATLEAPVAMGYVPPGLATFGQELVAVLRGHEIPCVVAELPFVPHRYRHRSP